MIKKILILFILIMPLVYAHDCTLDSTVVNSCNTSISIVTDKLFYNNSEKISFYNNLTDRSNDFIIQYWIEDSSHNIIKEKVNTTNTNVKSYTPKFTRPKNITIMNELVFVNCSNNSGNIISSKEVSVFVQVNNTPNINITSFYLGADKKASLGDTIRPAIEVYTGNSIDQFAYFEVVNITQRINISIPYDFEYYTLRPEIIIPDDCNIDSGNYTFISTFNNIYNSVKFEIINNCKMNTTSSSLNLSSALIYENTGFEDDISYENLSESNINIPAVPDNEVYNSAGIKAKKLVLYPFFGVILVITLAFMFNKNPLLKNLKNGIYGKSNNRSDRTS